MPAPTVGRFVWHELHTSDRTEAIKFYTTLMRWGTQEVTIDPGDPYVLCLLQGEQEAGITKSKAPAHVPSHWLPYIAVDDVDKAAAKAAELGAKILQSPMDIPSIGRFAAVMDPQGAPFAIFKDAKAYPAEREKPPVGAFCWEELLANDPEAAANFYSSLFGYSVETMDMGPMGKYRVLKRGDRQTAGILQIPKETPHAASWLEYIHISDVDGAVRNATELGAKVLAPARDIPNIGRFAVLADPTGAPIAVFKGP
jgi:predicted enzyme related to lactoylglutathione lyase